MIVIMPSTKWDAGTGELACYVTPSVLTAPGAL